MRSGDRVVVLSDPLEWGIGRIHHADKRGLLCVEFEGVGEHEPNVFELFTAHELELADEYMAGAGITLEAA
jgi:hypothetical protein